MGISEQMNQPLIIRAFTCTRNQCVWTDTEKRAFFLGVLTKLEEREERISLTTESNKEVTI